jgi:hypothetical protein
MKNLHFKTVGFRIRDRQFRKTIPVNLKIHLNFQIYHNSYQEIEYLFENQSIKK